MLLSFLCLIGCESDKTKAPRLTYEKFTDKENYLYDLTGNKIMLYNLTNIPADTKFKIDLTYEVYEKDKLIKEDLITSISSDANTKDITSYKIGLNFQDDRIRYLTANKEGYSSGSYKISEDLNSYCTTSLINDIYLNLDTETYIYYAANNGNLSANIPLGAPINKEKMTEDLKKNDSTILIKLSLNKGPVAE